MQKVLTFFSTKKKYCSISDIKVWNFNKTYTKNIVNYEQLGPDGLLSEKFQQFKENIFCTKLCHKANYLMTYCNNRRTAEELA